MILSPIKKEVQGSSVQLSVEVEWKNRGRDHPENAWYKAPDVLWYRFPKQYADILSENHNGFLIPLVAMAMFFKEDIHVQGRVSSTLLYNLREYQRILHFWAPNDFQPCEITCDIIDEQPVDQNRSGALSSYSGGIDSTFTLWSHLARNEPLKNFQVTHAMYIRGFDTVEEDAKTQDLKIKKYSELTSKNGIELIVVETNTNSFHQFDAGMKNYYTMSSTLASVAVFFENVIPHFYFSSDNTHDYEMLSIISHQLLPLFSTEKMHMSVFGASVNKLQKMQAISQWEDTHTRLVCCFEYPNGLQNCGKCEKCVCTMAGLKMVGILETYTTFPPKLSRHLLRTTHYCREYMFFPITLRRLAWEMGSYDFYFDYTYVVVRSTIVNFCKPFISGIVRAPGILSAAPYLLSSILKQKSQTYSKFVKLIKAHE